jgi:hypothetical protein
MQYAAERLARALGDLGATSRERREARTALLSRLAPERADQTAPFALALAELDPTPQDKRQARAALLESLSRSGGYGAGSDTQALSRLDPTIEDKHQAREKLLRLMADSDEHLETAWLGLVSVAEGFLHLARTEHDKNDAVNALSNELEGCAEMFQVMRLMRTIIQLQPSPDQSRRIIASTLNLFRRDITHAEAAELAGVTQPLNLSPNLRNQTRAAVLNRMKNATGYEAGTLARALAGLDPTPQQETLACRTLIRRLTASLAQRAELTVADGLVELARNETARAEAIDALFSQVVRTNAASFARALTDLAPPPEIHRQACSALLSQLADTPGPRQITRALSCLIELNPTPREKQQARSAVLGHLASNPRADNAGQLADIFVRLNPTSGEKQHARTLLRISLTRPDSNSGILDLAAAIAKLNPTAGDRRLGYTALLSNVTSHFHDHEHALRALIQLCTEPDDLRAARAKLISLLGNADNPWTTTEATRLFIELKPSEHERKQALSLLTARLFHSRDWHEHVSLTDHIIQLNPTTNDLISCETWQQPPDERLLAAARRNTTFDDWLRILPSLPPLFRDTEDGPEVISLPWALYPL